MVKKIAVLSFLIFVIAVTIIGCTYNEYYHTEPPVEMHEAPAK